VGQKLGQHFLFKGSILERIARAVCPEREPLVVEIGPGRGALTAKLLERADRVIAIEVDRFLVAHLREKYASEPRLEVIEGDVLAVDLGRFGAVPISGNLPYYITSPILAKTARLAAPRAVFLIQNEVADRLAAQPGSRDYGFLTVSTRVFADVRKLFEVKPSAFHPPPKVDSAVIELTPTQTRWVGPDVDDFVRFLGACFHQKRKTIRNNLAGIYGSEVVSAWPEAGLRAEQIPLKTFESMFRRVQTATSGNL
jgi:16S rRNA (adenine1518-N6/adenine1519-N6)-dimethyltransferase